MDLLKEIFADLTAEEIIFHYHGTYNVFIIKNDYIFRFPDASLYNSKGFDLIRNEMNLLKAIRDSLSFEIPNPIYCSKDENNPFVGYHKIPGISLSRIYNKIGNSERERIGHSIGQFLSEYHSYDLRSRVTRSHFKGEIPSPEDHFKAWSDLFEKVKKIVFPRIENSSKLWLKKVFQTYLDSKENFLFTPSLVHGDFDTSNILVDPDTLEITGIIDFEDAKISDPAVDLIFVEEGAVLRNAILSSYQGEKNDTLEERIRFYYCRAGTAYILYGVENNMSKLAEYGKLMLKKREKIFPYT